MNYVFITLFPDIIKSNFSHSILGRAVTNGVISTFFINPRDFAEDKHSTVDDTPFGGGVGMVLMAEPFIKAINKAKTIVPDALVVLLEPSGEVFTQSKAKKLSLEKSIIFVCGHYEGFDERIKQYIDVEISIGDYVLTGGELAAMVISDAVSRLIPNVLGKIESIEDESFSESLLEYPQYTRPAKSVYGDVPEVLLSGHHKNINLWRRKKMLELTYKKRPDLLEKIQLKEDDKKLLNEIIKNINEIKE